MIFELEEAVRIVTELNNIELFNYFGGHLSKPNDRNLNYNLLLEELKEYGEAAINNDQVGIADALGDLMVVLWGVILKEKMDKVFFEKILGEINKSNMSKFCNTQEEAIESCERYLLQGIKTHYEQIQNVDNFYAIINSDTGKILKGIKYEKPNINLSN